MTYRLTIRLTRSKPFGSRIDCVRRVFFKFAFGASSAFFLRVPIEVKKETAMNKNLTNSMILTAALACSAAGVFAQTQMTARVPFAFSTMGGNLSAGKYAIVAASSKCPGILRIRDEKSGQQINLGIGVPTGRDNSDAPRLVFKCADDKCALAEVWRDGAGYKFATPRVKPSQIERLAVIYLDRKNAD